MLFCIAMKMNAITFTYENMLNNFIKPKKQPTNDWHEIKSLFVVHIFVFAKMWNIVMVGSCLW